MASSNEDADLPISPDIKCWRAPLKKSGFPRISFIHEKLRVSLNNFKTILPLTDSELKQYISSEIDDIFCEPSVYVIQVLKGEDRSSVARFLETYLKDEAGYPTLCSADALASSMKDRKSPVVYLALLPESDMNEECGKITRMINKSTFGDKAVRKLLFVLNTKITSRSEMYNYVNNLTESHSAVSFEDECKGVRIFHAEDKMLTKRISRQIEDYVDKNIQRLHKLCSCVDVLESETLKIWENRENSDKLRASTDLERNKASTHNNKAGTQCAREISKLFVQATKDEAEKIYQTYCEIIEEFKDEIPVDVQISLCRIPGLKAFGLWEDNFEVTVSGEEWQDNRVNLLKEIQKALRGDENLSRKKITLQDITFRPQTQDMEIHLFARQKNCFGTITIWGYLEGREDDQIFFTCKHVVPDKRCEVKIFHEKCMHESADCICEAISKGFCLYTHGVEDINPLGEGLIDISCVRMSQGIDVIGIPGPAQFPARNVVSLTDQIGRRKNCEVYKIARDKQTVYGTYVGPWYVAPTENAHNRPWNWDCGHDHSIEIPLNYGPRKVDLIKQSQNLNIPFGEEGDSGGLVSFIENGNNVSPAFVYLGKWPDKPDTYMCFRLREALNCLEQGPELARFKLCFDDVVHNVNPR